MGKRSATKQIKSRRHIKFNTGTRVHKDKRKNTKYKTFVVDLGQVEVSEEDEIGLTINEKEGAYISGGDYSWKG